MLFRCESVYLHYYRYNCYCTVVVTVAVMTGRYVKPQRAPLTQDEQDRVDIGPEKLNKLGENSD